MRISKLCSALTLLALQLSPVRAEDLTSWPWLVSAADVEGRPWSSSILVFTEQTPAIDGAFQLAGYFDWYLNGVPQGRELVRGTMTAFGVIDLAGYELVNPGAIILDVYRAQYSPEKAEIVNGTFGVPQGVAGVWSAKPTLAMTVELKTPQELKVCWDTGTNFWYQVQVRSNPAKDSWVPLTGEWTHGSGDVQCVQLAIVAEVPEQFYQVVQTNAAPSLSGR